MLFSVEFVLALIYGAGAPILLKEVTMSWGIFFLLVIAAVLFVAWRI